MCVWVCVRVGVIGCDCVGVAGVRRVSCIVFVCVCVCMIMTVTVTDCDCDRAAVCMRVHAPVLAAFLRCGARACLRDTGRPSAHGLPSSTVGPLHRKSAPVWACALRPVSSSLEALNSAGLNFPWHSFHIFSAISRHCPHSFSPFFSPFSYPPPPPPHTHT